jgi:hypothetical protein
VLLAALCLLACAAHAAPLPPGIANVSYSVWTVSGSSVLLKFMLPAPVARSQAESDVPLLTTRKLGDYVLQHVGVQAAGRDCPAIDQGYDLGKVDPLAVGPDLYGFEILFRCAAPGDLTLRNEVLFARSPEHINFARVEKSGRAVAQLFTATQRTLPVSASSALCAAGFSSYARLGATHLLLSLDRLCFLLGALLLIRRKEEAAYGFAALLIGYLASLAAAAPDWIVPRATLLEAMLGFMVALLAAVITLRELRQPRVAALGCPALLLVLALITTVTHEHWEALALFGGALFAAGLLTASQWLSERAWLLPLVVVGFLDGFAVPSALAPVHLLHESQLRMTAGFDAGAALAAAVIMGVPLALFALARKRIVAAPRVVLNELAAACLGGLGTFWLVTRLFTGP